MSAFLIAGGKADPNLEALAAHAEARGVELCDLRAAPGDVPEIAVNPKTASLTVEGRGVDVTAAFIRPDVFTDPAPAAYKRAIAGSLTVLRGWLAGQEGIFQFNRDPFGRSLSVNKGAALRAAADVGLTIPETVIGNSKASLEDWLHREAVLIQKPVSGGDLCRPLDLDALGKHRTIPPVIAQSRIDGADLRIFRVGRRFVSFELRSPLLDYRDDRKPSIVPVKTPPELAEKLARLTDRMGLSWSASDFKRDPVLGDVYLETNANPMFVGFDRAAKGELVKAMFEAMGF